jgi:PEP-CTERM motif
MPMPMPEPGSLAVLGTALAGFFAVIRRRRA